MKRAVVLVLDGVGVGALPDAAEYGDQGSNTLVNLSRAGGGLNLPILEGLGLGKIAPIEGVRDVRQPRASYGKMAEQSPGKDSTTGHWELMGVVLNRPFPVYPGGFPRALIAEFERRIGRATIGNVAASGTEIINDLGPEHLRTGKPIIYTSADSVFQIACHEQICGLEELYRFCAVARELLTGEHAVARVIARPFTGAQGRFYRTPDRRDFSLPPPGPTLLDRAKSRGMEVIAVGKVDDLFAQRGYTDTYHSVNNSQCMDYVQRALDHSFEGLIVANFVQFDMDWGHRNDVAGFRKGLIEIDGRIGETIRAAGEDDLIFITADHGNDPTTVSTDHSREYVPILAYRSKRTGCDLGTRPSFADLARTIAKFLAIEGIEDGKDFYGQIA